MTQFFYWMLLSNLRDGEKKLDMCCDFIMKKDSIKLMGL